ncbi:MAG TPA: SDR family NAD(P)-dependent oxidoreductase [Nitrososphaerales archaeon]|nr:SDR family NAD(P)-dependent oxidoreductase [Nitrososphaerales archaeon]
MQLENKVAIVTGGASGIGEAICLRFAAEGAKVVVADMEPKNAEAVAKKIQLIDREVLTYTVEVSNYDQVCHMVEATAKRFGTVDILVNCAGISEFVRTEDLPIDKWLKMIDVNLTGTFYCCLSAGREMAKKGKGKIVNISSAAGLAAIPNSVHYVSSKHGVVGLTKAFAVDFAKYGINVNCICPGTTLTPMVRNTMTAQYVAARSKRVPLGRLGQPEDQANAALFLVSPQSDYITGLIMYVDGGMYALHSGYAGLEVI